MNMKCPVCGGEQYTVDLKENKLTCSGCGFYCDFRALIGGAESRERSEQLTIDERLDFEIVGGVLMKYNGAAMDVVVPEGVEEIQCGRYDGAFMNMHRLKSVVLPDSLRVIGPNTFRGCHSLETITLPEGLQSIGDEAFWGCSSLKSIELPDGLTSINYSLFVGCKKLTNVKLPEGLKEIYCSAFSLCESLTEIHIPNSIEKIHRREDDGSSYYDVFHGCKQLAHIDYPKDKIRGDVFRGSLFAENVKKQGKSTKKCPICGGKWGFFGCSKCGF